MSFSAALIHGQFAPIMRTRFIKAALHNKKLLRNAVITSRQSNLTKNAASPPHMGGSGVFARLRQCAPHVTHTSMGPPESTTQTASRSVKPFLYDS